MSVHTYSPLAFCSTNGEVFQPKLRKIGPNSNGFQRTVTPRAAAADSMRITLR